MVSTTVSLKRSCSCNNNKSQSGPRLIPLWLLLLLLYLQLLLSDSMVDTISDIAIVIPKTFDAINDIPIVIITTFSTIDDIAFVLTINIVTNIANTSKTFYHLQEQEREPGQETLPVNLSFHSEPMCYFSLLPHPVV